MKYKYDDTFLARWINNKLNSEELLEFQNSDDFKVYNKIIEASTNLSVPNFDEEKLLNKIKEQLSKKKKSKVISLKNRFVYGAVASIAIILSVLYFTNYPATSDYTTSFGEQLAVNLPDDSEVILNAKSAINFSEKNWNNNRLVNLEGEAFFKVQKGSKFTVSSLQGNVEVLGTQFNVNTNSDYFEVKCFEGKVRVTAKNNEVVLTKGMGYRLINNTISENISFDNNTNKTWFNGETSFESTPLSEVVKSIEKQYDIKLNRNKNIDFKKRFTGSFTHNDLRVALQSVFVPMEIDVIFTNESTISLVKK